MPDRKRGFPKRLSDCSHISKKYSDSNNSDRVLIYFFSFCWWLYR